VRLTFGLSPSLYQYRARMADPISAEIRDLYLAVVEEYLWLRGIQIETDRLSFREALKPGLPANWGRVFDSYNASLFFP
jgi:hypothetical protein